MATKSSLVIDTISQQGNKGTKAVPNINPDADADDKKMSNIRLRLYRPSGRVTQSSLGVANGQVQQFVLPHQAKQETIELNADWSYDADSQVLTVVGNKGSELVISYDWIGESQVLYSWTAGWSVA